jgi:hypothetical protein
MPRIDDLSDAEFMKLQAEHGDSLPICPICTLEDVRHLILELVAEANCPRAASSAEGAHECCRNDIRQNSPCIESLNVGSECQPLFRTRLCQKQAARLVVGERPR